ncbi:MAG TPA: hypothetical protein VGW38_28995, partial [Chloroflexota bacterium]|nr:hypothetical protein [Chloroflexota bacterium]
MERHTGHRPAPPEAGQLVIVIQDVPSPARLGEPGGGWTGSRRGLDHHRARHAGVGAPSASSTMTGATVPLVSNAPAVVG